MAEPIYSLTQYKDAKTMGVPMVDTWIQYWQPKPKRRFRLFCFPYAGGGASLFRSWSDVMPPLIEICPVQLPGRESRLLEKPYSEMPPLIDALSQALLPYLDEPYAFFGHSMGALISFELARYLRHKEHSPGPIRLFVSGHRAPQLPDTDAPTSYLPEPEFIAEIRRLKGTPEEVLQNTELLHLLLPLLRADFALCEEYNYVPNEPLTCPISAFGGIQDTEVSLAKLAAWKEQTHSSFTQRIFSGDHFYLRKEQRLLLQVLSQTILNDLHTLSLAQS